MLGLSNLSGLEFLFLGGISPGITDSSATHSEKVNEGKRSFVSVHTDLVSPDSITPSLSLVTYKVGLKHLL